MNDYWEKRIIDSVKTIKNSNGRYKIICGYYKCRDELNSDSDKENWDCHGQRHLSFLVYHGTYRKFDEDDNLIEYGLYKHFYKTGKWYKYGSSPSYDKYGELIPVQTTTYENGKKIFSEDQLSDLKFKYFYEGGFLSKAEFYKSNGKVLYKREYFKNGKRIKTEEY